MNKILFNLSFYLFLPLFSFAQNSLPEPYNQTTVLPFNPDESWYGNGLSIERLFKSNQIYTVIEVGSWIGASTRHLATLLPDGGKVYAVDHWLGSEEHQSDHVLPLLYEQFLSNIIHAGLTDKVIPIRMPSLEAAHYLSNIIPDLIYLDASHKTQDVLEDLNAWFPFVRGHGILCGDDWSWPGVAEAVMFFAHENKLTIQTEDNFWCLIENADSQSNKID